MAAPRRMNLVAYLKTGPSAGHSGGWRHPSATLDDIFEPSRYEHVARVLEAACFDAGFFADTFGLGDTFRGSYDTYLRLGGQTSYLDPMAVLPLMARVTGHLGLGATLSTTFNTPYWIARTLASLDHLSKGRTCWNVVTSATEMEARNFGLGALPTKAERYDRADEVMEACCSLWDGWQPDPFVLDREKGLFIDPAKVARTDYVGRHVSTRGPLTIPRSPQGRPVFLQAGASDRGRDFAARWAEAIFTESHSKADAQAFYADVKGRMEAYGRPPGHCAVLPLMSVVLGETEGIAREKAAYLDTLVSDELQLALTSQLIGVDLGRGLESEAAVLDELSRSNQGIEGERAHVAQVAREAGMSFAAAAKRPFEMVVGTPETVADHMEDWFVGRGADGFIVMPTVFPTMFEEFGRLVVPVLQRRGLFRTAYQGATLRDNLRSP